MHCGRHKISYRALVVMKVVQELSGQVGALSTGSPITATTPREATFSPPCELGSSYAVRPFCDSEKPCGRGASSRIVLALRSEAYREKQGLARTGDVDYGDDGR